MTARFTEGESEVYEEIMQEPAYYRKPILQYMTCKGCPYHPRDGNPCLFCMEKILKGGTGRDQTKPDGTG